MICLKRFCRGVHTGVLREGKIKSASRCGAYFLRDNGAFNKIKSKEPLQLLSNRRASWRQDDEQGPVRLLRDNKEVACAGTIHHSAQICRIIEMVFRAPLRLVSPYIALCAKSVCTGTFFVVTVVKPEEDRWKRFLFT